MMSLTSPLGSRDPAIVAAAEREKAVVIARYLMAVERPRDYSASRKKILETCKRKEFAHLAEYSIPFKGTLVKGASIRMAEVLAQSWGNIDVNPSVVFEDEKTRRIRVSVTDLECNTSYSDEITVNKTVERLQPKSTDVVYGQRENSEGKIVYIISASEGDLAKKENAAKSKLIRNAILRLIPEDIVKEAIRTCQETLNSSGESLIDRRKRMVDSFEKIGIDSSKLNQVTGKPVNDLIETDMDFLRSVYNAIKDGQSVIEDYFPIDAESEPTTKKSMSERANDIVNKNKKTGNDEPEESLFETIKRKIEDAKSLEKLNIVKKLYDSLTPNGTGELIADEESILNELFENRMKELKGTK